MSNHLLTAFNYDSFGMVLEGRKWECDVYRYGFQNQEIDPEIWAGAVSFKYRFEDSRLGRFFSIDPLTRQFPYNSPYAFSENILINSKELEGKEKISATLYGTLTTSKLKEFTMLQIAYDLNTKVASVALGIAGTVGVRLEYNTQLNTLVSMEVHNFSLEEFYDSDLVELGTMVPSGLVSTIEKQLVDNFGIYDDEIGEANQALFNAGLEIEVNGLIDEVVELIETHDLALWKKEEPVESKLVTNEDGTQKVTNYDEGTKYSLKTTENHSFEIKIFGQPVNLEGQAIINYVDQSEQ
jgi:hypothetical protein